MSGLKSALRAISAPYEPDLVMAQARALSRQIPLMYIMLVINSLILAGSYVGSAPVAMTVYVPGALTAICVGRLIFWWRRRNRVISVDRARRTLNSMLWITGPLALGFTGWAISLYPYGNAYQQSHIAFYMGITTIGCMFCLMHVRAASLIVATCVLVPFTVFFSFTGHPIFTALAVNMVVVVVALLVILLGNYRDFNALVASRSAIVQRQQETQRLSDENDRLANVDTLTGLPNRRSFDRHLAARLADAPPGGIAVALIDLDSFKSVNDIFGQITGDRVLVEVAHRIDTLRRPGSFLARLGGDNFALIMDGPTSETLLQVTGDLICHALRSSFELPGATIHLTSSVGFAASHVDDTAETLFDRADYATSVAKRDQRGKSVVFNDTHAQEISKVRMLEHALHTADLDKEMYILFQPQFDMLLKRTTGFEVLARWKSPILGEVSPMEFIPLAERTGMICKITQTVLRKALLVSKTLPRSMRLSVNLSAHDIGSATAIESIVALVESVGRPCRIDFEITETAVMRDLVQANDALLSLLALGARIALDDFGTGHSSLTHVQRLPLDRIKVDRSFVADVTHDPTSRAIVKTTIDLCRNLGISCVFEGIETEDQLHVLTGLGGSVMQGYLFGRPMREEMVHNHILTERREWGAEPAQYFGNTG
ncbi:putative bifunctional diguanylate cyclase/phosphodiesterase [Devosia aquimaris]|uniref:putative bifunctional diguanylate cyclase/phosphodiesterase n=1 Tax=Devosia aquimaris TaxID=2866214 RepID=UPI001CD0A0D9|nr:EAL domain-containing protein [Devosia sp. CJK-A8-3]